MFLGIDVGTSSVKAVIIDGGGAVVDQASTPLPISRPHPLWSEQNPQDWWDATTGSICALSPAYRGEVAAVGLAGQMHGATLLGPDDQPLRPAILWNDGRSHAECVSLEEAAPQSRAITGNIAMPGFTAPKLLWVRHNEPEVFDATKKVLLPKDYVRLMMTGEYACDMSDAAGTLWLDTGARDWSDDMLSACGLSRDHMPRLVEGSGIAGTLLPSVAEQCGMNVVPVAGGGGDNAAGAIGAGVVAPGSAFISLGTSGVMFAASEAYTPNPDEGVHTFCHALPNLWHQMSVMLSAASCIDWAVRLTGEPDAGALLAKAEAAHDPHRDLLFLPYLSGERTPHNNPHARGVLMGLDHDADAGALGQAVAEGVALAFRDGLRVLDNSASIDVLEVIGGGSRSAYWGKLLASALERPLSYREYADVGPAFGAARLAQIATGAGSVETVCAPTPAIVRDRTGPRRNRGDEA